MSEGRDDKSTARSRSLGVRRVKASTASTLSQSAVRVEDGKRLLCRRFALSHGANSMPLLACNSAHEVESLEL